MDRTFASALLGVLLGFGVLVACGGSTSQPLLQGSAVLATAHVQAYATNPEVTRQENPLGPPITVTRLTKGRFILDFGFDVSQRFYTVSPGTTAPSGAVHRTVNAYVLPVQFQPTKLAVVLYDTFAEDDTDQGGFFIAVH
ncbi:MAG: hypothetical protein QNJ98_09800 [Planctomycetota bacterium]|nr:hypothetical protein [Planctomycetota bacterium]